MADTGEEMLTIEAVARFFSGVDRTLTPHTIRRWVREQKIPPPVAISAKTKRWRRSELQTVMDEMTAKRVAKGGA